MRVLKRKPLLILSLLSLAILTHVSNVEIFATVFTSSGSHLQQEKPLNLAARFGRLRRGINLSHWFSQAPDYSKTHLEMHTTAQDIALIKAMEYGFLTIMLSRLVRLGKETLRPYLALGAGTGLVFGGAIVATSWHLANLAGPGMARAALTGMLINELLFPIGCVMVIYAIQFIGRQTRAIQPAAEKA